MSKRTEEIALVIIVILLSALTLLGTYFNNKELIDSRETITSVEITDDELIAYMNNTYDDTFTKVENMYPSNKGIYVESLMYPDDYITVDYSDECGKVVINDNYLAVKYDDESETYIKDILKNLLKNEYDYSYNEYTCKVIGLRDININGNHTSNIFEHRSDVSFNEFITNKNIIWYVTLQFNNNSSVDTNKEIKRLDRELTEALHKYDIQCNISIENIV